MAATQEAVSGLHSSVLMDIEATAIVTAYKALAAAQQRPGIEFGRLCFNFRKRSKVVSGGTTFDSTLDKLDIPRSTAYRWIARYEESIGMRKSDVKKPVQSRPEFTGTVDFNREPVEPVKQPSVKPIVVPNISTDSISNHTARLTEFWSHFNALNGVAKNIRTGVDKTEASTLVTLLQRISKDAAEKAVLIQNALDGVS